LQVAVEVEVVFSVMVPVVVAEQADTNQVLF
jgi:hypothetical protein